MASAGTSTATSSGTSTTTSPTASYHLYVATTGSDSNPGTQSAPFKTILKASQVAKPDTIIHVAPGTYAGSFQTTKSGTASGRIRYLSDVKWGAKIIPSTTSSSEMGWDNRGDYVDIEGFDIDGQSGTRWNNGFYIAGSYDVVKNNHVHNIADKSACTNHGGSGINADHYYYGANIDIIGNVVHNVGPAGCTFVQGIYFSTSGSVKNNLIYNIAAVGISLWHDATNVNIANNTIFGSWFGIVVGGGERYHGSGPDDYTHVSNNIVFDNTYGIAEQGSTGTHNTYTNNLAYQNTKYNWSLQNGMTHAGDVSADPQFVNYIRAGGGDYHLKSTSPAVDKGTTSYAPSVDLDGIARPQGAGIDIGAYEHH